MIDGISNRTSARERAVKCALAFIGFAPENSQAGKVVVAEADVGIAFIVTKQDVIARIEVLD